MGTKFYQANSNKLKSYLCIYQRLAQINKVEILNVCSSILPLMCSSCCVASAVLFGEKCQIWSLSQSIF